MKVRDVIGTDAYVTAQPGANPKPDITIVTPTYQRNAEGLLRQCLDSARNQTFLNYEHIIIDDGSTDGTRELVLEYCERDERIVYVRHETNSGLPAVRTNEGILRARGSAVAFLFDDNRFKPDFLENAWSLLGRSGADVVQGAVDVPTEDGREVVFGAWPLTLDLIRGMNTIANGGMLIRRDFFDRFGLYDPHLAARRLCDWELWVRSLWLGARFQPLPKVVAEERGHVSPTSLGNTVAVDWKVSLPYLQDTSAYADRARRFSPSAILEVDVLDPAPITPYVRDLAEWESFAASTYTPFLNRRPIPFDPLRLTNRTESVDPAAGWNPAWALHQRRFRVFLLANSLPGIGSLVLDAVRTIPGAIVVNGPEWNLPLFEPSAFDLIISLDGGSPTAGPHIERHCAAGTRLLYISAYGEQDQGRTVPFEAAAWSSDPYIQDTWADPPYFPQAGHGRAPNLAEHAERQQRMADIVVDALHGADMGRLRGADEADKAGKGRLALPALPVPALSASGRRHAPKIAYRLTGRSGKVAETIARSSAFGESLASLVVARPGTEIRVEQADLETLPPGEAIAIAALAAARQVDVVASKGGRPSTASSPKASPPKASPHDRLAAATDWQGWFANLVRVVRLRRRLGVDPRNALTIDIYLNSELFAGSEVYGLRIAKLLSELGVRARVRLPERNIYGEPDAINAWLAGHGLPPAVRAPYLPSVHHSIFRAAGERAAAVARLHAFVYADPPDLILACCHLPQLAEMPECPPLFMAFFSAAAYQQTWLRDLHGRVQGVLSDSRWALQPTAAVIGAPSRVVPSPVIGTGGGEIARITGNAGRRPVRVALAGTVMPRKRQLEAVQAVAALRRRGYDLELHLYGFELEMMRDYVALVDQTIAGEGMTDHIVRHGFVESETEITRDNDVVLCASTDESLPQGLLFQMYQGLIGVSVLCGGVDEMVVDGRTGYLARNPNPSGLADALARALDDRANWRNVAEEARRHIHERCGSARVAASLLEFFEEGVALGQPGYRQLDAKARAAAATQSAVDDILATPAGTRRSGAAPEAAALRALLGGGTDGQPPRIAYFCHSPHLGGAENVMLKLTRMAAAYAFQPILVLPLVWGDTRAYIHRCAGQAGIAIHQLPIRVETAVVERPLDAQAIEAIRHWLRANDIGLVHSVTLMREVGEATRMEGIPHVASLFATHSEDHAGIDHCDAVHSDTWLYANRWHGVLGAPAQRILSSVPDVCFAAGAERRIEARVAAIKGRQPVVGLLGTLQARKGQLQAIKAVGKLRRQHGLPVRLRLYGYANLFPDYVAECRAAAAADGIEDLVEIHGFVEEGTHHALRDMDIILCASDWESLPQSILEGMAAGALIITPRVGGIPEVLSEESAIFIPDNAPDSIAQGILRAVFANPAALSGRMELSRSIALAGCADDIVASSMFRLYAQAVSSRPAKRREWETAVPSPEITVAAALPSAPPPPPPPPPPPVQDDAAAAPPAVMRDGVALESDNPVFTLPDGTTILLAGVTNLSAHSIVVQ